MLGTKVPSHSEGNVFPRKRELMRFDETPIRQHDMPIRSQMREYKITARERTRPLVFIAVFEVQAASEELAIEAAKQRFREDYPKRSIEDHSFERDRT